MPLPCLVALPVKACTQLYLPAIPACLSLLLLRQCALYVACLLLSRVFEKAAPARLLLFCHGVSSLYACSTSWDSGWVDGGGDG